MEICGNTAVEVNGWGNTRDTVVRAFGEKRFVIEVLVFWRGSIMVGS